MKKHEVLKKLQDVYFQVYNSNEDEFNNIVNGEQIYIFGANDCIIIGNNLVVMPRLFDEMVE